MKGIFVKSNALSKSRNLDFPTNLSKIAKNSHFTQKSPFGQAIFQSLTKDF